MAAEGWSGLGERGRCAKKGEDGAREEEEDAATLDEVVKRQSRSRTPSLGLQNQQPGANRQSQPRARRERARGRVATPSPDLSSHPLCCSRYPA